MIAAKCPYEEIPGIFELGNPFSREIGEKKYYATLNFNYTKNNIQGRNQAYL